MTRLFHVSPILALMLVLIPVGVSAQGTMTRDEFLDAYRRGLILPEALEDGFLGLSAERMPMGWCVEYRQARSGTGCSPVAIYLDGVRILDAARLFETQPIQDVTRAEVLSSLEATTRYGSTAGWGALIIETQLGSPSSATADEPYISSDWSLESAPYPWARVAASSVLATSAGLGLALLLGNQCPETNPLDSYSAHCSGMASVGAKWVSPLVPGMAGSFAARWAGTTDRSKGLLLPSAVLGSLTSIVGYRLFVGEGRPEPTDAARVAGALLVFVATPLVTVLSDRFFRALR